MRLGNPPEPNGAMHMHGLLLCYSSRMKIIDLSLPLYSGVPVFSGDPEVSIEVIQTIEKDRWNMRRIEMNGHDGTHVNVPAHAVKAGKTLDAYTLEDFCGDARIYRAGEPLDSSLGYIVRERTLDEAFITSMCAAKPRFLGFAFSLETDIELKAEKETLAADIISYERLANTEQLPDAFRFFGMPLPIRDGDGSPVRAFAIVD